MKAKQEPAKLFPQATPIELSKTISLIPLVKLRDMFHPTMICELYSTYSAGWHWISSVVADTAILPSGKIIDVYHHPEAYNDQELEAYLQGFTMGADEATESNVGTFKNVKDLSKDPFQMTFHMVRLLQEMK
jgi:hypothetical protein